MSKDNILKLKLKRSNDRGGTYYLSTFLNGRSIIVDSWEYPELFKELLNFYQTHSKVWNSRNDTLSKDI